MRSMRKLRLIRAHLLLLAAGYCLLAGGGCSTFERDWEAAALEAGAAGPIEGRWQGEWRSEATGHTGELRAIVRRTGPLAFEARYRARWGCCFSFEITVPLPLHRDGEGYAFAGEHDLGWPWGTYRYRGTVRGPELRSTYETSSDRGVFALARPGATARPEEN
jgi:hypothetical protein